MKKQLRNSNIRAQYKGASGHTLTCLLTDQISQIIASNKTIPPSGLIIHTREFQPSWSESPLSMNITLTLSHSFLLSMQWAGEYYVSGVEYQTAESVLDEMFTLEDISLKQGANAFYLHMSESLFHKKPVVTSQVTGERSRFGKDFVFLHIVTNDVWDEKKENTSGKAVLLQIRHDGLIGSNGGGVEDSEGLREALHREIFEELNVRLDDTKIKSLATLSYGADHFHSFYIFLSPNALQSVMANMPFASDATALRGSFLLPLCSGLSLLSHYNPMMLPTIPEELSLLQKEVASLR